MIDIIQCICLALENWSQHHTHPVPAYDITSITKSPHKVMLGDSAALECEEKVAHVEARLQEAFTVVIIF